MAVGWLPVVLWVLVGGIFFGAVHDFGALYASMKNNGKSLAQLIEKYIGKTGRRLFLLFCWLFCIIVIAAFTDMVCKTFMFTPAVDASAPLPVPSISPSPYAAGCAGNHLHPVHLRRYRLWLGPEEVQPHRCRRVRHRCGPHSSHVRRRYAVPDLPG